MAKVKLLKFRIASLLGDSKEIMDYLQKYGSAHIDDIRDEGLIKYDTSDIVISLTKKLAVTEEAIATVEKHCEIKRGLIESFTDFKTVSYERYLTLTESNEEAFAKCLDIKEINNTADALLKELNEKKKYLEYIKPWEKLDIVMASKRTLSSRIFIGSFNKNLNGEKILQLINNINPELDDVVVEVVSSGKLLTCAVIICHESSAAALQDVLSQLGFVLPDNPLPLLPSKITERTLDEIASIEKKLTETKNKIIPYATSYDELRFLYDYITVQIDKYRTVELAASSEKAFFLTGYVPERDAEELRFIIESRYNAYFETEEPDYEDPEVPVLLENGAFASGVEGITEMYSPVSNKDIDPNPVMSFFYYAFFGLMLSDAGYGILMVLFSIFAEKKLKVRGSLKKSVNMIFYSGISSIIFGALFGGWFGDLIPVICTTFLGFEKAPDMALWLDPVTNSITLLVYCLGFGIIHLFAGLILNGYKLIKCKNYAAAVFDTVPVMIFVSGFAVFGATFLTDVPEAIANIGNKLLAAGAVLIVLTSGRSAKYIIGKFGGGHYGLYNVASGYLGDILSYSRLLALGLVTGVIASSINLMATMPGNPILFILIFLIGHTINIAINLIGTYVHTNRLQYVEFFSKFYEGEGKVFTPFRINSKHIIIKEDK